LHPKRPRSFKLTHDRGAQEQPEGFDSKIINPKFSDAARLGEKGLHATARSPEARHEEEPTFKLAHDRGAPEQPEGFDSENLLNDE